MDCSSRVESIDGVIRSIRALFNDSGGRNMPRVFAAFTGFWPTVLPIRIHIDAPCKTTPSQALPHSHSRASSFHSVVDSPPFPICISRSLLVDPSRHFEMTMADRPGEFGKPPSDPPGSGRARVGSRGSAQVCDASGGSARHSVPEYLVSV